MCLAATVSHPVAVGEDVVHDIAGPAGDHAQQRITDAMRGVVDALQIARGAGRLVQVQPVLAVGLDLIQAKGVAEPGGSAPASRGRTRCRGTPGPWAAP